MAQGDLVVSDWSRLQALGGLLSSPATRLPRAIGVSQLTDVPTDESGADPWVPLLTPTIAPIHGEWIDVQAQWITLGSDAHARWVETGLLTWTVTDDPDTGLVSPYTVRAIVYAGDPRASTRRLFGVVRLPTPVTLTTLGEVYTYVPRFPVRSAVTVG